ncbi:MAG TPA: hypothetical protein VG055_19515, partial [Planctomycetaceae bacterium]|nr:hypothetical protein [Planctomycetaceae bacterium]
AAGLPGPDPMTYDIGTGQFVCRGNAPAPGAAGVREGGTRPAAAGSTCLNLDLIRLLEQGLGQPVGNEAPASNPQPEEPLTACAASLPSPAPGSAASSGSQSGRDTGRDTGRDMGRDMGQETSPDTRGVTSETTGRDTSAEKQKCESPVACSPVQGAVWWQTVRAQGEESKP